VAIAFLFHAIRETVRCDIMLQPGAAVARLSPKTHH